MRYKTAFRLAVRLVGVFVVAWYLPWCLAFLATLAWRIVLVDLGGGALPMAWEIQNFVAHLLGVGIGSYLFWRGGWIVDRAIPSNRPYCHECGYELTGLTAEGVCPECGTPYRREVRSVSSARRPDET